MLVLIGDCGKFCNASFSCISGDLVKMYVGNKLHSFDLETAICVEDKSMRLSEYSHKQILEDLKIWHANYAERKVEKCCRDVPPISIDTAGFAARYGA